MKKLLIILVVLAFGCQKNEITPQTEGKTNDTTEKNIVYLITYENMPIVNKQDYATNESQIIELVENNISIYKEYNIVSIDYETGIIICDVLNDDWISIIFKLYTFHEIL